VFESVNRLGEIEPSITIDPSEVWVPSPQLSSRSRSRSASPVYLGKRHKLGTGPSSKMTCDGCARRPSPRPEQPLIDVYMFLVTEVAGKFASTIIKRASTQMEKWWKWTQDQALIFQELADLSLYDNKSGESAVSGAKSWADSNVLATPADGECGQDVELLLKKYRDEIQALKDRVRDVLLEQEPTYPTKQAQSQAQAQAEAQGEAHVGVDMQVDDVFFLRYVLAANAPGTATYTARLRHAAAAIRRAIKWRRENYRALQMLVEQGLEAHPAHRLFEALTGITWWQLTDGGWLDFIGI